MSTCFASVNSRTHVRKNKRARRAFFLYHPHSRKRTMKGDLGLIKRWQRGVRGEDLQSQSRSEFEAPQKRRERCELLLDKGESTPCIRGSKRARPSDENCGPENHPSPHPVGRDDRLRPKHAFSNFSYFTIETPQSASTTRNSSSIHFRSKPTSAATLTLDSAATPARVPESSVASRLSAAIRRKRVSC